MHPDGTSSWASRASSSPRRFRKLPESPSRTGRLPCMSFCVTFFLDVVSMFSLIRAYSSLVAEISMRAIPHGAFMA